MTTLEAVVLAVIEGITEFLPISSTGHMIIASSFFGIAHEEFTKLFTIVIQLGAILSVVALYFKRFFQFNQPLFFWNSFEHPSVLEFSLELLKRSTVIFFKRYAFILGTCH